jgi:two-component system, NtrC family, response regulator GlrR
MDPWIYPLKDEILGKIVKEIRIFLLDLTPELGHGLALRQILESNATQSTCIKELCPDLLGFDKFLAQIANAVPQFNPSLVFLILARDYLDYAYKLIQSLKDRPLIGVVEGLRPPEMIDLLRMGIIDFIIPPLKAEDLLPRIWKLLEQSQARQTIVYSFKEKIGLKQMIGISPVFIAAVEKIPIIARSDATVLISGRTGTGKELFARAIHYLSPRAGKSFIPASCGAIPVDLVENELFGHMQGAFTSAASTQPGLIQEAEGGTLFLDEIDSLPLLAQVKLLRFLQEKEYKQLGSAKARHADIRVIAATNHDLKNLVNERKFREDLYYRLNIIPLDLPALKERKEDIPLLVHHFALKYSFEAEGKIKYFSSKAIQNLIDYDWPGNVRELENLIERAIILSKGLIIQPDDIFLPQAENDTSRQSFKEAKSKAVEQFERKYIQDLLIAHNGNISKAATAVHKNRRALWELIRKHRIDAGSLR